VGDSWAVSRLSYRMGYKLITGEEIIFAKIMTGTRVEAHKGALLAAGGQGLPVPTHRLVDTEDGVVMIERDKILYQFMRLT
jgi:hypothetical protein